LLRGKGTGAVLFAAAAQISATEKAIATVSLLIMPFALNVERYTSRTIAPSLSAAVSPDRLYNVDGLVSA
jgi:hypothetical protein